MAGTFIVFQPVAKFSTIHSRHHNVGNDQVGNHFGCFFQTGNPVNGLNIKYSPKLSANCKRMSRLSSTISMMGFSCGYFFLFLRTSLFQIPDHQLTKNIPMAFVKDKIIPSEGPCPEEF